MNTSQGHIKIDTMIYSAKEKETVSSKLVFSVWLHSLGIVFYILLASGCSQNLKEKKVAITDEKIRVHPKWISDNPIVFDNFELTEGLEIADLKGVPDSFERRRVIQLGEGSKRGRAENYFFDQSAKYDITLFYVDGVNGKSGVNVIINGRNSGNIMFGLSNTFKEKTISGINIQKWSKISLEFTGDDDEKCRIEKLVITPIGAFDGQVDNLVKPKTLRIFETAKDQLFGDGYFLNLSVFILIVF